MADTRQKVAVLGATGRVGSEVAETLAQQNWSVVAAGRSADKAKSLAGSNVEFRQANILDPVALKRVFDGSEYLVYIYSPDPLATDQREFFEQAREAALTALRDSTIKYIVNLSSTNVVHGAKAGPAQWLGHVEMFMNALASIKVVHVRSCFFAENLTRLVGKQSTVHSAIDPSRRFEMTPVSRVAATIVRVLNRATFDETTVEEVWPQFPADVIELLSTEAVRQGVAAPNYHRISPGELRAQLAAEKLSSQFIEELLTLHEGINDGLLNQRARGLSDGQ
jgi:uncharacterized protein YbjT (DUF2867 family)